ncbi:MAG: helix-turn-helix domain-containing protein [Candidatus Bathyarchaeia archaeon]
MSRQETGQVKAAKSILKKAGFTVSQIKYSRPSCFDIAARKDRTLVLIKVQHDIGAISPKDSLELRIVCQNVSATSLIIGDKTRDKPLEDDTVYSRYNVPAVTSKTFEDIILREIQPLIQAGPGGYYVEIDGEALRRRRQELGMSVGDVAEKVGVSRRTLYGYERGMTRASVTAAYKLLCTLGDPVVKTVEILKTPKNLKKSSKAKAKRMIAKSRFLKWIFRNVDDYDIVSLRKVPFDFLITVPEEDIKIIGSVAEEKEAHINKMIDEIIGLSRVVQAQPVLVTEDGRIRKSDIPCISREEISRIRKPEELCKL